jgi:hypothetical protein
MTTKRKTALKKQIKAIVGGKAFTMKELGEFHIQRRGFPSILRIGKVMGEGQVGGFKVTEIAHEVENQFVKKLGQKEYQKKMDKVITKIEKKGKMFGNPISAYHDRF